MKRGPNKIQNPHLIKEMYLDYIKDKDHISPYYISYDEYYNICSDYYKWIMSQMIDKSRNIKLPFKLGYLYIGKHKPSLLKGGISTLEDPMRSLSVDWKETKKLGKWVRHINDHSRGFKYRFYWSKIKCHIVNKEFYRLVLTRTNKRYLAKIIKSGECDYLEV